MIINKRNVNMQNGITLVSLIITIIVLLILLSTGITIGIDNYKLAAKEAFISRMQTIQIKVDEAVTQNTYVGKGTALTNQQINILNKAAAQNEISTPNPENYRYFSSENLKINFNLENIDDDVMINFNTREVVSVNGIKYSEKIYYTQYTIDGGQQIVENSEQITRTPASFSVNKMMNGLNAKLTISDISITNGTLSYKEKNDADWVTINNYTVQDKQENLTISISGEYQFKLTDNINSENNEEKTISITTTNGPKENDEIVISENTYDYNINQFAIGNKDLETYVWIPRFAYEENEEGNNIKFLKGTTNISTEGQYIDTETTGYKILDKFKNDDGNKVTGVWVKYTQEEPPNDLINTISNATNADLIIVK